MGLIAVAVLMSVIGFLAATVAMTVVGSERVGRGGRAGTRRGSGALALLAGGCALAVGGHYALVRVIDSLRQRPAAGAGLGTVGIVVLVAGAGLLGLAALGLYRARATPSAEPPADSAEPARPEARTASGAPYGAALATAVAGLIVALAGLVLSPWLTSTGLAASGRSDRPGGQPQPVKLTPQEVAERYHEWFYTNLEKTWDHSSWVGVKTLQNPNDVWITQEIISEVKPDFIIEAGTYQGGSAILWAMILEQVNPQGKVITIDIEDMTENARKVPIWQERVEFIKGSSTDPKIVADLTERVKDQKVLVILDSDHHKEHVLNELKAYSPMVPVGSYILVQDTNINGHPVLRDFGPGPMEAVEEFLSTNNSFAADRTRERFLFTMNPKGYLKRVW